MNERDELTEQIGGFIEAYTGYGRDEGKRGWSVDVRHTSRIVADVDSLIAEIIELVRADERQLKGAGLQNEIAEWANARFGGRDDHQRFTKLQNEVAELGRLSVNNRDGIKDECADIMHLLFQYAYWYRFDLLEETRKKFEINKQRTWEPQPDGTYQHVKEPTDAS